MNKPTCFRGPWKLLPLVTSENFLCGMRLAVQRGETWRPWGIPGCRETSQSPRSSLLLPHQPPISEPRAFASRPPPSNTPPCTLPEPLPSQSSSSQQWPRGHYQSRRSIQIRQKELNCLSKKGELPLARRPACVRPGQEVLGPAHPNPYFNTVCLRLAFQLLFNKNKSVVRLPKIEPKDTN